MLHDNEASNLALKGMVDADFASQPLQWVGRSPRSPCIAQMQQVPKLLRREFGAVQSGRHAAKPLPGLFALRRVLQVSQSKSSRIESRLDSFSAVFQILSSFMTVNQMKQCSSGLNGSTPLSAARRWEHTRVLASKLGSEEATGSGMARLTNLTGSLRRLWRVLPALRVMLRLTKPGKEG
jgi:hypothetical protein